MSVYKKIELKSTEEGQLPPTEMLIEESHFTIETIKKLIWDLIVLYTEISLLKTEKEKIMYAGVVVRLPSVRLEISAANADVMAKGVMMVDNNRRAGRTIDEIIILVSRSLGKSQALAIHCY